MQYMCTSTVSKMLGRHHWSLVQWLEDSSSYELVPLKYTTKAETIKEFWWHKKRVHCCHCNVESSEEIYQNLVNTRYLDTFVFFTTQQPDPWNGRLFRGVHGNLNPSLWRRESHRTAGKKGELESHQQKQNIFAKQPCCPWDCQIFILKWIVLTLNGEG